jgi:hypothetical protein
MSERKGVKKIYGLVNGGECWRIRRKGDKERVARDRYCKIY